ncbi:MAG: hypothetical protein Q8Q09_03800 [Deltaproteobacteria bacterium]|nr:hypothetical protein [Deltaproteobacteria bacterium]
MAVQWGSIPARALRNVLLDVEGPKGALQMYFPVRDVLVTRASGHLELAQARDWIRVLEPQWKHVSKLRVFNDWDLMTSYESASRRVLTEWVLANRRQFEGAWFSTRSQLVAMGVAAAGALTALAGVSMNATRDRTMFEETLRSNLADSMLPNAR